MNNDLNRSIKIYIDGTEAASGVKTVEAAIQKLESQLAALNGTEANYATRSRQLQKEIAAKNKTLQTYKQKTEETDRVLKNLSGSTYNQLIAVQSQVRKQLRDAIPGTQQYNAALEQNRRVTEALTRSQTAMRVEVGCHASVWGRSADFINKYIGLAGAAIAAITGVTMKLNQLRDKRNEREEAKADVEALTGLDKESIAWLEQQAIQLSNQMTEAGIRIRQSATEILDAYKLVGSAKPELLNDKEALAEVTEQTLILASASGMKLKDAVDAVTLSMNQYGAEADQAARFTNVMAAGSKYGSAAVESVTSAITKSGVAAASAGVPIEQLVGTIETLAEKGIKDEIAGTGLKKFFLTLQTGANETNPAIVGLETALDNMQKKQLSATQIKKLFGEEGYNVASVLINEAEKVKYYTDAVTGTTVAMEQAATKSETAAAKLDQAKNKMGEMGIELMEKLNPSIISVINGTVSWTGKLISLIGFIVEHSGVIITLTTTLLSYTIAVKALSFYENNLKGIKLASIAVDKIADTWHKIKLGSILALSAAKYTLAGNTTMASAAMQRFTATMKSNAIGLVISLLTTVVMAIYQFSKRTKEATTDMEKFSAELIKEQRSLNSLFDALKRSGKGTEDRRILINEINKTYGTYLPNLLTEKSSIDEIREAYTLVNKALETQIATKIRNAATNDIITESVNAQAVSLENMRENILKSLGNSKITDMAILDIRRTTTEYQKAGMGWEKAWGQAYHTIQKKYLGKKELADGFGSEMEAYIRSVYEMEKKLANTEAKFRPFLQKPANELDEVLITGQDLSKKKQKNTNPDTKSSDTAAKAALEAEKKLIKEFDALREQELSNQKKVHDSTLNAYRQMLLEKRITQEQSELLTASTEKNYAETLLNIEQAYHAKSIDLQINDKELKESNISSSAKRVEQAEQQSFNTRLSAEEAYSKNISAMRDMIQQPELSPEEKLKTQYDIQKVLLESIYSASLNYARKNGQDETEVEQVYLSAKKSLYEKYCNDKIEIANNARIKMSDFMGDELSQEIAAIYDSVTNLQLIFEHFAEGDFWSKFKDSIIHNLGSIAKSSTKSLNSAFSTFQQIETNNIDKRYNAEIAAAQGNSEKIETLEKEKAQKKLDIEKKYADVQFGIKASEIIANTALSIMQGFAQLGPIAGIASAVILAATGAVHLAAANSERNKVKNMTLDSAGSSTGGDSPKTAQVKVSQWATGRYNVIGQDDGKSYNDIPYIGPAPTGIVRRTSLVSENGAELIVNAEDLARLQRHINYPIVLQAIDDARSGRVAQRATGNYDAVNADKPISQPIETQKDHMSNVDLNQLIATLNALIPGLKNLKAYVVLRDLHEAEDLDTKSKKPFTKQKK